MNHKLKSLLFKTLSMLPNRFGYGIYHWLQKFLNRNSVYHKIKTNDNSFKEALSILEKANISVKDKNILEIGSGWSPIIPYFFKYFEKAKAVYTFDINKHYDKKVILKLNDYFESQFSTTVKVDTNKKYPLPEAVYYYPKTDLASTVNFPEKQIDLIFSRFVLEHVPPEALKKMHENFAQQLQKPFYVLHMISPSDHRAYTDKSLSYYDFLKYSKDEWKKVHTKFDYHNRMRLPQYMSVFKDLNYEVVSLDYDTCETSSEKYRKFKELTLHKDYTDFTEEELLAGSINVLLKFG